MRLALALLLLLMPVAARATATVTISPSPIQRFVDNNGNACVGCKLFTYAAGTTTKLATYTDATGGTQQTNPIIMNSRGEPENVSGFSIGVWLTEAGYKFVLAPATDTDPPSNPIWTIDGVVPPGNVQGPSTATTVGDIPLFANTTGNVLSDSGISYLSNTMAWTATRLDPSAGSVDVPANLNLNVFVQGDRNNSNMNVRGGIGVFSLVQDYAGTTLSNSGVGYAGNFDVYPIVAHGAYGPSDDMDGILISNVGTERATSGLSIGGSAHSTAADGNDFVEGIGISAYSTYGILLNGHSQYGISFNSGGTYQVALELANNLFIEARNATNTTDLNLLGVKSDNKAYVADLKISTTGTPGVEIDGPSAASGIAILIGGTYANSVISMNDTSGIGIAIAGTYSNSGISMSDTSPTAIVIGGTHASYGIDMNAGAIASGDAMRIPNASAIFGENSTNNAAISLIGVDSSNIIRIGNNATSRDIYLGLSTAILTTATEGFPSIPTRAGRPSGTPTNAVVGQAQITIDVPEHKICWYEQANTAWKCALGS